MIIETKFSPGDDVFVLHNNSVYRNTVYRIQIDKTINERVSIGYQLKAGPKYTIVPDINTFFDESLLFSTKEELLASL